MFLVPIIADSPSDLVQTQNTSFVRPLDSVSTAAAGGVGAATETIAYMTRDLSGFNFGLYNSYTDSTHNSLIDLSGYQVAGWTLYSVTVDATQITATAERETLGITPTSYIDLVNSSGTVTDVLYQAFYNQPHDGKLENYSLTYNCPYYGVTSDHAWLVVRSDFQDPLTNTTGFIEPWVQDLFNDRIANHDTSGDNAILNASTYYFAVIDGTGMQGSGGWFNTIRWSAANVLGIETGYHLRNDGWYLYQGLPAINWEAELNYTYTPWNTTSNAALIYTDASQIGLAANSTPLTGTSWTFTSSNNITHITFQSTQSIEADYNLVLRYKKTENVNPIWFVGNSGDLVQWNVSRFLDYPVLTGTLSRYLNITIPNDWNATGLYNGTTEVFGTHNEYVTVVQCTDMTNGIWTLSCASPNYVVNIALTGVTNGKVSILTDVDIVANIEDGGGAAVTGGSTNLTVLQAGGSVHSPAQIPASGGLASFVWDIDSTTLGNGTHSIEIWWTDGLEAGYRTVEVFVYYPTTLVADDYVINAYAENSFDVGINFDQVFPAKGLDAPNAVTYTFGATVNASLDSQTGGRWTKTVDTTGMSDGTYMLYVYAEGYAVQNQSLTLTVNLVYQTQALIESWSNSSNIQYLWKTNLSIIYQTMTGTRIDNAMVNVTIQGTVHDMAWDPTTETYWIELTGENFTGVPGTFFLNVSAWKAGYEVQFDDTISITVGSQTGEVFNVDYSSLDISYIQSLFIQVSYNYSGVPIDSNTLVRVFFNGSPAVTLNYNNVSLKWETTLYGSDYFGAWEIFVLATADGYTTRRDPAAGTFTFIVDEDIPIVSNSWSGSSELTDYDTVVPFTVTMTDSMGSPVNDATISFTAFSVPYSSSSGVAGVYTFSIVPNATRGVEHFTVNVTRVGYTTSQMDLQLTVEATTSLVLSHSAQEYEEWFLIIEAEYMDTFYNTPITDAVVNITLAGQLYTLLYDAVDEVYVFNVTLDVTPTTYTINAQASALYYAHATDQSSLEVIAKRFLYIEIAFAPPQVAAGQFMEVRATLYSNETDFTITGYEIQFEISIIFANGTIIVYADETMTDVTNLDGVATYGFDVPEGDIETLSATASYAGSREEWSIIKTETTGVEVSIIALVFAFFTSDIGLMIILSITLLGIVAAGYNRGVKPKKKAAKLSLENQLHMFKDLETVQHFMAVYLDRGTCVFYHPFTEERIQPDLISGFIAAITSVYGEIKGDGVRGTLEEIQYHGLRLNSYSGQYIIGILILEGEMTPLLRERLQFFVELFENQYDQDLDGWTGLVDCFDPEWVVSTLNSAFNYAWHLPHRFGPTQKVSKVDAKILDYIGAIRDERSEFYVKNLLSPLAEMLEKTEAEVLDRLLFLQDRGVIIPIGIQTILQRQGLALANGSDEGIMAPPPPAADEPKAIEEPEYEEAVPEPVEELEFEDLTEETAEEPQEEAVVEPEPEVDPMEAFVQDVESLLVAEVEDKQDDKEEGELDQFMEELRAKIGEDEDEESKD